jgi:hypothetical protein
MARERGQARDLFPRTGAPEYTSSDRRPVSVMGATATDGRIVAIDALIDPTA